MFVKEIYLGKLTRTLNEEVVKQAKSDRVKTDALIKFILDYYKLICSENTQEMIKERINSFSSPQAFRNVCKEGRFKLYTVIEPFYHVGFEEIRSAANLLGVKLDEKVIITMPDGKKIKTDVAVPVGITLIQFLEHFSSAYVSIGGSQKYSGLSKQPVKVGGGQNVSSLGQHDINALITYGVDNVMHELLTARSDHHKSKRTLYSNILENGQPGELIKEIGIGGTAEIKNLYLTALGLDVK